MAVFSPPGGGERFSEMKSTFSETSRYVLTTGPISYSLLGDNFFYHQKSKTAFSVQHVGHPHRLYRRDQLGQGGGGVDLSLQLSLHVGPAIFDEDEEEGGAMDPHEGQKVVLQDSFVVLTVHSCILREKIEATSPHLATKAAPDHDTGAVLDSWDGVPLLVTVQPHGPPHFPSPGVYQPKSRLIGEHYSLPLLGDPVEILLAKLDPLPSHQGRQQGLLSGRPGRHLEVLLQNFLNTPHQNAVETSQLLHDFTCGFEGIS